jgi:tetratricopeptide (TPR) repeat protein
MKRFIILFVGIFLFSCEPNHVTKEVFVYRDLTKTGKQTVDSIKELAIKEGLAGHLDKALELSLEALKLDSMDIDNLSRISGLYLLKNNYTEALKHVNKSISLDTNLDFEHNYATKALIFYEMKKTDSADVYFNKMLALKKYNAVHMNALTESAGILGSEKYYEFAELTIKYYPYDILALGNAATAKARKQKYEEAISYFNMAEDRVRKGHLEKEFDLGDLYYKKAICYHNDDQYLIALEQYNKAIKYDSTNLWYYGGRARTYQKLKKLKESEKDYLRGIKSGDTAIIRQYKSLLEELEKK